MAIERADRRAGSRDRALAWLVTGPLGRAAAFVADLSVAWWRWVTGREQRGR